MLHVSLGQKKPFLPLNIMKQTFLTWSGVAVLPVPMAHTGSYAMTTLLQSLTFAANSRISIHFKIKYCLINNVENYLEILSRETINKLSRSHDINSF